jgi:glycosyltransferase involved in cell wall biosynthesis
MDILYISTLCSKKFFNQLYENTKIKPQQQAQKYHKLMVEGLSQNEGVTVTVLSAIPLNSSMTEKLYYKAEIENENGIEYNYLPFFRIPILRHAWLFILCFFKVLKWSQFNKQGIIICDVLNISISFAALLASKIYNIQSVGIVTDVPVLLAGMTTGKINFKKNIISQFNTFTMNRFDAYIFLTEQMNELINKKQRPYVVIEGQVDINMAISNNDLRAKHKQKICLYAGALHKIYGLKILTDAFADIDGAELHIYGAGDFEEDLKTLCMQHHNIKYFGVVPNDIVVAEELKATLLVNPRPTKGEYTKYSFPSKIMEYMVSGTPVLTTPLKGMPKEYYDYVYLFENESVDGMRTTINNILKISKEELHHKGYKSKEYVLNFKNNVVQAGKVIKLFKEKN